MYDKKNHHHTSVEYRNRNVTIEMILLNANKVITTRLSYCFRIFVKENAIFGYKWAQNGLKIPYCSNYSSEIHRNY